MARTVVLATVGSLGDLHPFIAVGRALREAGVSTVLAAAPEYRDKAAAAGLRFHAVRPGFEQMQRDLGLGREELTRAVMSRSDFLFRKLLLPNLEASFEDMMACTADADLVLTSTLAFGARLAAEKRGVDWLGVVLQPMMLLSAYDPPVVPHMPWLRPLLRGLGPSATRAALKLLRAAAEPLFGPLRRFRARIGLPPDGRSPLFEGQFSALGAIALYSRLLGAPRPDHPHPTTIAGFAEFDGEDGGEARLDPALAAFLDAGTPPLVFTLGSVVVNHPGNFYRESAAAARALGRRAVLLAGERAPELRDEASSEVLVCNYAPHSLLFPRAAAIAHHGGIGTLAQALRSGRPQLIVPHFADQQDNAQRAVELGVARKVRPAGYRAARAARDLDELLRAPGHAGCAAAARELARERGAERAARRVLDTLG